MPVKKAVNRLLATCTCLAFSLPVQASDAGAFVGGMLANRVLHNMKERTDAEQAQAYYAQQSAQQQQVRQAAPAASSTQSTEAKLAELKKLHDGGYISQAEYAARKKAALDCLLTSDLRQLQAEAELGRRFLKRIKRYVQADSNPEELAGQDTINSMSSELVDDFSELIAPCSKDQKPMRQAAARDLLRKAMRKAESFDRRVSVPKLAAELGAGQRNLELAFKRYLGITPRRYLYYLRMHQVHRELSSRSPESRCVTEVAGQWNFTELGRFAGDYRELFGELPSETLQHSPMRPSQPLLQ